MVADDEDDLDAPATVTDPESEPIGNNESELLVEPADASPESVSGAGNDQYPASTDEDAIEDRHGVLVDTAWDPRAVPVAEPATATGEIVDYRPVVIRDQSPDIIGEPVDSSGMFRIAGSQPKHNWRDPVVIALLILAAIVIAGTIYLLM
jgi:hypothetical protein